MKKQRLLLLKDVKALGRSGDVVSVRGGYWRNFLQPRMLAVMETEATRRLQEQLRAEREKQAAIDRKEAEAQAASLNELVLKTRVKVDAEGKLYGSVTLTDIVQLLDKQAVTVERQQILLPRPIKAVGSHKVNVRLKEGVTATFTLEVESEEMA